MLYKLILLLLLLVGCSARPTYKPGQYVRDKFNGESYMILYDESNILGQQYRCRELSDSKYSNTTSKFEVELEPYSPSDSKAEKKK